jgi:hypothetical protein
MSWTLDVALLSSHLHAAGYDVDDRDSALGTGGSLTARRERGPESTMVVVDAGGRVRMTVVQERDANQSRVVEVEGGEMNLAVAIERYLTLTGRLTSILQFEALIKLDGVAISRLAARKGSPESVGREQESESSQGDQDQPMPWWARNPS